MTGTIALRSVTDDDDDFLRRVFSSTRGDVLAAPLSADERDTFLDFQYRAQRSDYERRFPRAQHSIVLVEGEPHGRVWIDRNPDEIRLLDIALLPEHQGRGTGRVLLERLVDEARVAGRPLRHSVASNNPDALRFYRRLGFTVIDDLGMYMLMEWTAAGEPGITTAG